MSKTIQATNTDDDIFRQEVSLFVEADAYDSQVSFHGVVVYNGRNSPYKVWVSGADYRPATPEELADSTLKEFADRLKRAIRLGGVDF